MADDNDTGDFADVAAIEENLEEAEEATADVIPDGSMVKESRALAFLTQHHPECRLDYVEDVMKRLPLSVYPPDHGADKNHKGVPYLTLFEKTKVIGFRANQLAQGARPLVEVPDHVTDVLDIARLELDQRRLPFILKRPFPDGSYEYVRLADLLML